jgi:hypothetical protein
MLDEVSEEMYFYYGPPGTMLKTFPEQEAVGNRIAVVDVSRVVKA